MATRTIRIGTRSSALALWQANRAHDYQEAENIRSRFLPLEDRRDQWGPARVLHAAVELAGIATTGPIPPYQSPLPVDRYQALREALQSLTSHPVPVAG